jgi:hypothetical protein
MNRRSQCDESSHLYSPTPSLSLQGIRHLFNPPGREERERSRSLSAPAEKARR